MNIAPFINGLTQRLNEYKARMGLTYFTKFEVFATEGKKFFKVYRCEVIGDKKTGTSIVAFVDKTTGDIFKPAGCAVPAKHIRGNVNSPQNGMEAINENGFVNYLRG